MDPTNETALSGEIQIGMVRQLQKRINTNGDIVNSIVDRLVDDYTHELDEYMNYINGILNDTKNPPTDRELDEFTLKLPVLLYFTGGAQEALGVKEDVAKAVKQELYNEVYNAFSGTVGDKKAKAELATQNEYIAHVAYQRAYKKIKLKMDAGYEVLASIKKVISRRVAEFELSRMGGN